MTQDRDEPPTAAGSSGDEITSPDEGTAPVDPDSYTLAGPGSDPMAPAAQPVTVASGQPGGEASTDPPALPPTPATTSTASPVTTSTPTSPTPVSPRQPTGDYDKYGVPTLDLVRDKIEARYAASLGAEELARETEEAKSFEQRAEERAKAAEAALEAIRQSLRKNRQS